MWDGHCHSF
ncbi:hypothetical protein TIFTF001_056844 [Ficus carica]|uniref:Uncharacterized protein n=1 Tax=Ficus carica TaxID=3494 RepID=A0AA88JFJ1_FICCA|nr:hypothetical protein TIFTF001_050439 [Ficus carica]GMN30651.1 hypothetical protein TIFTF001_041490 [Ficus carica]GMN30676.1 hypothetical protein TIFTF001_041492 [Ficus carica]GMN35401.1 hypothetical protein TIFTF001_042218 [Ficus carica]GMN37032.1 hypothetical protein TIFTF001_042568 [Ficus carica]